MAGEHAGHRQRMRERFRAGGLEGFADHEVLELMLFYAIPQRNVNPLAHRLLDRFGTLHAVLEAPVEELMKVEGVGQYAALLLSLFSHAARRLEMSRENTGKLICNRGMAGKARRAAFAGPADGTLLRRLPRWQDAADRRMSSSRAGPSTRCRRIRAWWRRRCSGTMRTPWSCATIIREDRPCRRTRMWRSPASWRRC